MRPIAPPSRVIAHLLVLIFALFLVPAAPAQDEPPAAPLPVFEFHSGFWLNLHHTLYRQARLQRSSAAGANAVTTTAGMNNLSPSEARAWNSALAFYTKTYADKDLTVSLEMILIKNQLGDFETCADLPAQRKKPATPACPLNLRRHSSPPRPSIARTSGPNTIVAIAAGSPPSLRWSAAVASTSLIASPKSTKLPGPRSEFASTSLLLPARNGAYTTLDPLRVTVASTDTRNQGAEALEVFSTKLRTASPTSCRTPFFANAASATNPSRATSGTRCCFTRPGK